MFNKGNKNAVGNKGPWGERVFRSALLQQLKEKNNKDKLREIAQKLIDIAADGESWAVKEFADRIDGRPAQQVMATGGDGGPIRAYVEVSFVSADKG